MCGTTPDPHLPGGKKIKGFLGGFPDRKDGNDDGKGGDCFSEMGGFLPEVSDLQIV